MNDFRSHPFCSAALCSLRCAWEYRTEGGGQISLGDRSLRPALLLKVSATGQLRNFFGKLLNFQQDLQINLDTPI